MQFQKTMLLFLPFLAIMGEGLPHSSDTNDTDDFSAQSKIISPPSVQSNHEGSESAFTGRLLNTFSVMPRMLKSSSTLFNIFSMLSHAFEPKRSASDNCALKRGSFFNGECYEFFTDTASYSEAVDRCRNRGGDLWTPDLYDPFLYQKLIKFIPQLFRVSGEDVWLGAKVENGRIIDRNGFDVTNSYLVGVSTDNTHDDGDCISFEFPDGSVHVDSVSCTTPEAYICEYPLESEHEKFLINDYPW